MHNLSTFLPVPPSSHHGYCPIYKKYVRTAISTHSTIGIQIKQISISPAKYTQIASSSSGFPFFPLVPSHSIFSISGISVGEFSVNSVPMYPGLMQFTRTPRFCPIAIASDFVSWITPAFDALYAQCGCGTFTICADMEAVLMMEPPPFPAYIFLLQYPLRRFHSD